MKKKAVKKSTLFNMKGILILLSFMVWVNLIFEVKEEIGSISDFLQTYAGNTALMLIIGYTSVVILGLFFEAKE